jgi:hypothetical protein
MRRRVIPNRVREADRGLKIAAATAGTLADRPSRDFRDKSAIIRTLRICQ